MKNFYNLKKIEDFLKVYNIPEDNFLTLLSKNSDIISVLKELGIEIFDDEFISKISFLISNSKYGSVYADYREHNFKDDDYKESEDREENPLYKKEVSDTKDDYIITSNIDLWHIDYEIDREQANIRKHSYNELNKNIDISENLNNYISVVYPNSQPPIKPKDVIIDDNFLKEDLDKDNKIVFVEDIDKKDHTELVFNISEINVGDKIVIENNGNINEFLIEEDNKKSDEFIVSIPIEQGDNNLTIYTIGSNGLEGNRIEKSFFIDTLKPNNIGENDISLNEDLNGDNIITKAEDKNKPNHTDIKINIFDKDVGDKIVVYKDNIEYFKIISEEDKSRGFILIDIPINQSDNTIKIKVFDKNGNEGNEIVKKFFVDNIEPHSLTNDDISLIEDINTDNIINKSEDILNKDMTGIRVNITELAADDKIVIVKDNLEYYYTITEDDKNNNKKFIDIEIPFNQGENNISIYVEDRYGNKTDNVEKSFIADTISPNPLTDNIVEFTEDLDKDGVISFKEDIKPKNSTNVKINDLTDIDVNDTIVITLKDREYSRKITEEDKKRNFLDIEIGLNSGDNLLTIYNKDDLGNRSTEIVKTIILDNNNPSDITSVRLIEDINDNNTINVSEDKATKGQTGVEIDISNVKIGEIVIVKIDKTEYTHTINNNDKKSNKIVIDIPISTGAFNSEIFVRNNHGNESVNRLNKSFNIDITPPNNIDKSIVSFTEDINKDNKIVFSEDRDNKNETSLRIDVTDIGLNDEVVVVVKDKEYKVKITDDIKKVGFTDINIPINQGENSIKVFIRDDNQNISNELNYTFNVDTIKPNPLSLDDIVFTEDTNHNDIINNIEDKNPKNETKITIDISNLDEKDTITIKNNGLIYNHKITGADKTKGSVDIYIALNKGVNNIEFYTIDENSNISTSIFKSIELDIDLPTSLTSNDISLVEDTNGNNTISYTEDRPELLKTEVRINITNLAISEEIVISKSGKEYRYKVTKSDKDSNLTHVDITIPISQGDNEFTIHTENKNNSSNKITKQFVVDTIRPGSILDSDVTFKEDTNRDSKININEDNSDKNRTDVEVDITNFNIGDTLVIKVDNKEYTHTIQDIDKVGNKVTINIPIKQGNNNLEIFVRDTNSNESPNKLTKNIVVDTIAPNNIEASMIKLTEDVDNNNKINISEDSVDKGRTPVKIDVTGLENNDEVVVLVKNVEHKVKITEDIKNKGFVNIDIPIDQGSNTLTIYSKDEFGNTSTPVTRVVEVDTIAPSSALSMSLEDDLNNDNNINYTENRDSSSSVIITLPDNIALGDRVKLKNSSNNHEVTMNIDNTNVNSKEIKFLDIPLIQGDNRLKATIIDNFNNSSNELNYNVRVDNIRPESIPLNSIDIKKDSDKNGYINDLEYRTPDTNTTDIEIDVPANIKENEIIVISKNNNVLKEHRVTTNEIGHKITLTDIPLEPNKNNIFKIHVKDDLGNVSTDTLKEVVVDRVAPNPINRVEVLEDNNRDNVISYSESKNKNFNLKMFFRTDNNNIHENNVIELTNPLTSKKIRHTITSNEITNGYTTITMSNDFDRNNQARYDIKVLDPAGNSSTTLTTDTFTYSSTITTPRNIYLSADTNKDNIIDNNEFKSNNKKLVIELGDNIVEGDKVAIKIGSGNFKEYVISNNTPDVEYNRVNGTLTIDNIFTPLKGKTDTNYDISIKLINDFNTTNSIDKSFLVKKFQTDYITRFTLNQDTDSNEKLSKSEANYTFSNNNFSTTLDFKLYLDPKSIKNNMYIGIKESGNFFVTDNSNQPINSTTPYKITSADIARGYITVRTDLSITKSDIGTKKSIFTILANNNTNLNDFLNNDKIEIPIEYEIENENNSPFRRVRVLSDVNEDRIFNIEELKNIGKTGSVIADLTDSLNTDKVKIRIYKNGIEIKEGEQNIGLAELNSKSVDISSHFDNISFNHGDLLEAFIYNSADNDTRNSPIKVVKFKIDKEAINPINSLDFTEKADNTNIINNRTNKYDSDSTRTIGKFEFERDRVEVGDTLIIRGKASNNSDYIYIGEHIITKEDKMRGFVIDNKIKTNNYLQNVEYLLKDTSGNISDFSRHNIEFKTYTIKDNVSYSTYYYDNVYIVVDKEEIYNYNFHNPNDVSIFLQVYKKVGNDYVSIYGKDIRYNSRNDYIENITNSSTTKDSYINGVFADVGKIPFNKSIDKYMVLHQDLPKNFNPNNEYKYKVVFTDRIGNSASIEGDIFPLGKLASSTHKLSNNINFNVLNDLNNDRTFNDKDYETSNNRVKAEVNFFNIKNNDPLYNEIIAYSNSNNYRGAEINITNILMDKSLRDKIYNKIDKQYSDNINENKINIYHNNVLVETINFSKEDIKRDLLYKIIDFSFHNNDYDLSHYKMEVVSKGVSIIDKTSVNYETRYYSDSSKINVYDNKIYLDSIKLDKDFLDPNYKIKISFMSNNKEVVYRAGDIPFNSKGYGLVFDINDINAKMAKLGIGTIQDLGYFNIEIEDKNGVRFYYNSGLKIPRSFNAAETTLYDYDLSILESVESISKNSNDFTFNLKFNTNFVNLMKNRDVRNIDLYYNVSGVIIDGNSRNTYTDKSNNVYSFNTAFSGYGIDKINLRDLNPDGSFEGSVLISDSSGYRQFDNIIKTEPDKGYYYNFTIFYKINNEYIPVATKIYKKDYRGIDPSDWDNIPNTPDLRAGKIGAFLMEYKVGKGIFKKDNPIDLTHDDLPVFTFDRYFDKGSFTYFTDSIFSPSYVRNGDQPIENMKKYPLLIYISRNNELMDITDTKYRIDFYDETGKVYTKEDRIRQGNLSYSLDSHRSEKMIFLKVGDIEDVFTKNGKYRATINISSNRTGYNHTYEAGWDVDLFRPDLLRIKFAQDSNNNNILNLTEYGKANVSKNYQENPNTFKGRVKFELIFNDQQDGYLNLSNSKYKTNISLRVTEINNKWTYLTNTNIVHENGKYYAYADVGQGRFNVDIKYAPYSSNTPYDSDRIVAHKTFNSSNELEVDISAMYAPKIEIVDSTDNYNVSRESNKLDSNENKISVKFSNFANAELNSKLHYSINYYDRTGNKINTITDHILLTEPIIKRNEYVLLIDTNTSKGATINSIVAKIEDTHNNFTEINTKYFKDATDPLGDKGIEGIWISEDKNSDFVLSQDELTGKNKILVKIKIPNLNSQNRDHIDMNNEISVYTGNNNSPDIKGSYIVTKEDLKKGEIFFNVENINPNDKIGIILKDNYGNKFFFDKNSFSGLNDMRFIQYDENTPFDGSNGKDILVFSEDIDISNINNLSNKLTNMHNIFINSNNHMMINKSDLHTMLELGDKSLNIIGFSSSRLSLQKGDFTPITHKEAEDVLVDVEDDVIVYKANYMNKDLYLKVDDDIKVDYY